MGGDLSKASTGRELTLIIRALRDPDGANLDRIQVIKGWANNNGESQERVYDVVCSDGRTIRNGQCDKPVGNTVDVDTATYTNSIGDALLMGYWKDPDFDPNQRAFYYVRIPSVTNSARPYLSTMRRIADRLRSMVCTHSFRLRRIWVAPSLTVLSGRAGRSVMLIGFFLWLGIHIYTVLNASSPLCRFY